MAIRARYKGNGTEFYDGIPARNLDDEEYDALTNEQRALLRGSPLYDVKTEAEMGGPTADASRKAPGKDGD